jgi:HAAS domain-containing protein
VIEAYLSELDATLRGPRRTKADLLAEARDHLLDAAEAYEDSGLARPAAERAATADFGTLEEVAPAYQAELGWTQGRRTALTVLFVFAAQPFLWDYAVPWVTGAPSGVNAAADEVVEGLGGVTILLALLTVLAHRFGMRHPSVRVTGVATVAVCVLFIALGTVLAVQSGTNPLWTMAFVTVPMGWTAIAARRCLAWAQ